MWKVLAAKNLMTNNTDIKSDNSHKGNDIMAWEKKKNKQNQGSSNLNLKVRGNFSGEVMFALRLNEWSRVSAPIVQWNDNGMILLDTGDIMDNDSSWEKV